MRTTKETKQHAKAASEIPKNAKVKDVCWVFGPSALSQFVYKHVETTAVDIMHCLANMVKKLGFLWFDSQNHDEPYSLTKFLHIINKRILNIRPLYSTVRHPRTLTDISYWKASELKLFLSIYSIPVLCDLMDPTYFNHHKLIVYAFYLLNQTSISEEDRDDASKLIEEYVSQFNILYGDKDMTCVLHTLRHLPEVVKRLGPLCTTSCFRFKNANGVLKNFVQETKYAELQICSSVSLFLNYCELKE